MTRDQQQRYYAAQEVVRRAESVSESWLDPWTWEYALRALYATVERLRDTYPPTVKTNPGVAKGDVSPGSSRLPPGEGPQ